MRDGQPQFSGTTQEHFLIGVGSILVGTQHRPLPRLGRDAGHRLRRQPPRYRSEADRLHRLLGRRHAHQLRDGPRRARRVRRAGLLPDDVSPADRDDRPAGRRAEHLRPARARPRSPRLRSAASAAADAHQRDDGRLLRHSRARGTTTARPSGSMPASGYPERVDLVEAEGGHGVQPANLQAITQWMRRWLVGKDDAVSLDGDQRRAPRTNCAAPSRGRCSCCRANDRYST